MKNDLTLARQLIKQCQETQNPYLELGNCGIEDLDDLPELFECTHLQSLNLSNEWWDRTKKKWTENKNKGNPNVFDTVPLRIESLKNLKDLVICGLEGGKLRDIRFLEKLSGLQTLDLSGNQISDIRFLEKLSGLQTLDLSNNQISDIRFLEKLSGLQNLDLSNNQISDIRFLEKLSGLQTLDLSGNQISDIRFLEKLSGLQTLYLSSNQILDIRFLEKLSGLQSLALSRNPISDYSFLEKLSGLQTLYLSFNQISDIRFLEKLSGLQTLDLRSNQISDIRFLEKLSGLQTLDLNDNQISDIRFLEKLSGLQNLYLSNNQISDIRFLEKLSGLQTLDLSDNQISDIRFLEKLSGLQNLYLSGNQISDIRFLEKLSGLQTLDLEDNLIKEIPLPFFKTAITINFGQYPTEGLCLADNPIESPPLEIIKQGKKSVLDWFAANKKKLNEIKIILIGDPKAGKTSLLRRLKNNEFNEKEEQTDGVNIESIQFSTCDSFKENNALHNLTGHFWDFGGQEIMNATHQFFLTKRSVYILMLDARKDTNTAGQVRQWVKRVSATGGNSPIIVVANQIDVNTGFGFSNQVELQQEFPQIKGFIEASCKTEVGLDKIKKKLEELVPKADLFNTEIDERWIKIKEQLEEETRLEYFLDETRFKEICSVHNVTGKEKRKNAIDFFNDLGLLLHFEDLNLAEYYVLDPYWITYGVYRIVTSKYAGKQKGIVGIDMLDDIVNEEEDKISTYQSTDLRKISYTTNQIWFLVNALHQFKLCFYFNDRSKLIIPDLLDTREPTEVTNNIRNAEDCIRFVYEYDYLPSPLIPYIMVETNNKLEEFWRTGCVLTNESCKALVSTYNERLLITVAGEPVEKTYFMAVLRNLVERINKKLNVDPKMLVPLPDLTNEFADYEVLLNRAKRGKKEYVYHEDKDDEKTFDISLLLNGIPGVVEMETVINRKLDEVLFGQKRSDGRLDIIIQCRLVKEKVHKYLYLKQIKCKLVA